MKLGYIKKNHSVYSCYLLVTNWRDRLPVTMSPSLSRHTRHCQTVCENSREGKEYCKVNFYLKTA